MVEDDEDIPDAIAVPAVESSPGDKPADKPASPDKLAAEKLAAEKLAAEKLAAEKLAADKLAPDKLAPDKSSTPTVRSVKIIRRSSAAGWLLPVAMLLAFAITLAVVVMMLMKKGSPDAP